MTVINASAAATLLQQKLEKKSGSEWELNPRPLRCWHRHRTDASTGITEVVGSNPAQSLNFFRSLL